MLYPTYVMGASFQNRGVNNTTFSPNADKTAQITGSGQPVPGSVAPTYAATVALDSFLQYSTFIKMTLTGALTLTAAVPSAGAILNIQLTSDGTGRTTTFSTGFRSTGTLAGTASQTMGITFVSDGTTWNEMSRTTAYA